MDPRPRPLRAPAGPARRRRPRAPAGHTRRSGLPALASPVRRHQPPAPEKKMEEKIFIQHLKNWFNIFEMLV